MAAPLLSSPQGYRPPQQRNNKTTDRTNSISYEEGELVHFSTKLISTPPNYRSHNVDNGQRQYHNRSESWRKENEAINDTDNHSNIRILPNSPQPSNRSSNMPSSIVTSSSSSYSSQPSTSSPTRYKVPSRRQSLHHNDNEIIQQWTSLHTRLINISITSPSANTQLYKILEELKQKVNYPIMPSLLPTQLFLDVLFDLHSIIISYSTQLIDHERLYATGTDISRSTPSDKSSYLILEQQRLTLSTFFQLFSTWLHKKQLIISDLTLTLRNQLMNQFLLILKPHLQQEEGRSWVSVDGIRCLSHLIYENSQLFSTYHEELFSLLLCNFDSPTSSANPSSYTLNPSSLSSFPLSIANKSNGGLQESIALERKRVSIICLSNLIHQSIPIPIAANGASVKPISLSQYPYSHPSPENEINNDKGGLILNQVTALIPRILSILDQTTRTVKENTYSSSNSPTLIPLLLYTYLHLLNTSLTLILSHKQSIEISSILSCLHRFCNWGAPLLLSSNPVQINHVKQEKEEKKSIEKRIGPVNQNQSLSLLTNPPHLFSPFASPSLFSAITRQSLAAKSSQPEEEVEKLKLSRISDPMKEIEDDTISITSTGSSDSSKLNVSRTDEKVRFNTVRCLHTLATYCPKQFHLHWYPFLPTDINSALSPRPFPSSHFLTIILYDPFPSLRSLASSTLSLLLMESPLSRGWLANSSNARLSGKERKGTSTNTKLGVNVGVSSLLVRHSEILRGIHSALFEALKQEQSHSCLLSLLHSIAVLSSNTPYQHLTTNSNSFAPILSPIVAYICDNLLLSPDEYETVTPSQSRLSSRSHSRQQSQHASPTNLSPSHSFSSLSDLDQKSSSSCVNKNNLNRTELKHSIFTTLAAIFSTAQPVDDLVAYLDSTGKSTIIPLLIAHGRGRRSTDPTPDAFTVLSALARHYRESMCLYWCWDQRLNQSSLSSLLLFTLYENKDMIAKTGALKILEEWTKTDVSTLVSFNIGSNEEVENEEIGWFEPSVSSFFQLEGVLQLYSHHLPQLYRDNSDTVKSIPSNNSNKQVIPSINSTFRAHVLTCLSFLPYSVYTSLSPPSRSFCIDCAKLAASDTTSALRIAASRSLSLFALYLSRISDGDNHSDTSTDVSNNIFAEFIQLLLRLVSPNEIVQAVRVRAAWSIANLCDYNTTTSATVTTIHRSSLSSLLTSSLYQQLIKSLLTACNAAEKIACNAIRAIGNLAYGLSIFSTNDIHVLSIWFDMTTVLIESLDISKGVKLRWNAAYAIGNAVKNPALADVVLNQRANENNKVVEHLNMIYISLLSTLSEGGRGSNEVSNSNSHISNYKVKINAVGAISAPRNPFAYGQSFLSLISTLRLTYSQLLSNNVVNARDVKYKETLRLALVLAILHLLSLLPKPIGTKTDERSENEVKLLDEISLKSEFDENLTFYAKLILKERIRLENESNRAKLNTITSSSKRINNQASLLPSPIAQQHLSPTPSSTLVESSYQTIRLYLTQQKLEQFERLSDGEESY